MNLMAEVFIGFSNEAKLNGSAIYSNIRNNCSLPLAFRGFGNLSHNPRAKRLSVSLSTMFAA